MNNLPGAKPGPSQRSPRCPCLQRWWGSPCSCPWSSWKWSSSSGLPGRGKENETSVCITAYYPLKQPPTGINYRLRKWKHHFSQVAAAHPPRSWTWVCSALGAGAHPWSPAWCHSQCEASREQDVQVVGQNKRGMKQMVRGREPVEERRGWCSKFRRIALCRVFFFSSHFAFPHFPFACTNAVNCTQTWFKVQGGTH